MIRFLSIVVVCIATLIATQAGASQRVQSESVAKLHIYIDISSKPFFSELPAPKPLRRLNALMEKSGISYTLVYLPWSRALSNVHEYRNTLIYQLLRTPDRENKYIWLMEATNAEPLKLVGRKGYDEAALQEDIRTGTYTAACYMDSAQCDLLLEFGFRNGNLLRTSKHVLYHLEALLANGRVDFIPVFESSLKEGLDRVDERIDNFESYAVLDRSVDYLAGVKGQVDPEIVTRLKVAAKQLHE